MSRENRRIALIPLQPLNGQRVLRISGSPQNEVTKELLRLTTVNVGALSRSKEVMDMFERRRVDIGYVYRKLLGIGTKEPEYY